MAMSALRSRSPAGRAALARGDADARPEHDLAPAAGERPPNRLVDAVRHLQRRRHAALLDEHGELVAAEPRRGVARADAGEQPPRQLDQQLVAGGVAEGVVDVLEVVEVDEEHRDPLARSPRACERVLEPLGEQHAVGEVGERVVERLVGEALLELLALVHAAQGEDHAAEVRVLGHALRLALDEAPAAVGPAQPPLGRGRAAGPAHGVLEQGRDERAVLGVDDVGQREAAQPAPLVAEEAFGRGRVVADLAFGADHEHDVRGVLDQRAEAGLVCARRPLRAGPAGLAHGHQLPRQHGRRQADAREHQEAELEAERRTTEPASTR